MSDQAHLSTPLHLHQFGDARKEWTDMSKRTIASNLSRSFLVRCCLIGLVGLTPAVSLGADGDINLDGNRDAGDVVMIMNHLSGVQTPLSVDQQTRADIAPMGDSTSQSGEGTITVADLLLMMRSLNEDDLDDDLLTDVCEDQAGTSPFDSDSDDDGETDEVEDPDQDAVTNSVECAAGLDPQSPDYGVPSSGFLSVLGTSGSIEISWDGQFAGVGDVASFRVHRVAADGSSYVSFEVDGNATAFSDTTASGGTLYLYWVQAVDDVGQESEFASCSSSSPASLDNWVSSAIGGGPNFPFTFVVVGNDVHLGWIATSVEASVNAYQIWRATGVVDPGSTSGFNQLATLNGHSNNKYVVQNLAPGLHSIRITTIWSGGATDLASARQIVVGIP